METLKTTVRALPLLVFAALAALAFVQSFAALRDVAVSSGAVEAHLAWITPLIIDGTIVAASAVAWSRALDGRHHWPALFVIAAFGTVSIGANMLHANATWVARGIASLPPVALLVCVELAMAEVRRWARTTLTPTAASGNAENDPANLAQNNSSPRPAACDEPTASESPWLHGYAAVATSMLPD